MASQSSSLVQPVLLDILRERGFKYADSTIHVFACGSDQHGAKGEAKGDLDICGVYMEPPEMSLGINREEHFVTSTGSDDRRNTSEDKDVNMYALRKWAFMAAKGNPTVLSYLFMPATTDIWNNTIRFTRSLFLAKSHVKAFVGFGRGQYDRINGKKGKGKHGQRDEIIEKFGYDTKAAMHMIRMMYECIDLLDTGTMTFPHKNVQTLIDIRLGKFTKEYVSNMYLDLEAVAYKAAESSPLPETIDRQAISKLISDVYLEYYQFE